MAADRGFYHITTRIIWKGKAGRGWGEKRVKIDLVFGAPCGIR
jgi:hypothetical protein